MRRLVLVRHSKASHDAVTDLERPLTPKGTALAGLLAKELRKRLETTDLLETPYEGHDLPQLLVLSSDETTPFTLWLEYRGQPLLSLSSDGIQEPLLEPVE